MLIVNNSNEAKELDLSGKKLVLLPGQRNIPEGVLPPELLENILLGNVIDISIVSEYPSITLECL